MLYIDYKITTWKRCAVDLSDTKAEELLSEIKGSTVNCMEDVISVLKSMGVPFSTSALGDTEEDMHVTSNEGQPTVEIFDKELIHTLYTNGRAHE